MIVTIDLEDLLAKTGYALTSDGTLIRTDTALAAADQADIYWAINHSTGQILHLGRTRRIATLPKPSPSTPATSAAPSPAATLRRNGANDTTSCPGPRAA